MIENSPSAVRPVLWQLKTSLGTYLVVEEKSGTIRHVAEGTVGFRQLVAWFAQSKVNICFLLTQDSAGHNYLNLDGDEFRGGPLSYHLHVLEPGVFALSNTSTGKFITFQPLEPSNSYGTVTAEATTIEGASRLSCVQVSGVINISALKWLELVDTSSGGILSPDAILDLTTRKDPAPVGVIAALFRLLSEDAVRALVAKLAHTSIYPKLFEYIRQHLSKQGVLLWGTGTDVALDFWIRKVGYKVGRHTYGSPTIWSGLLFKEATHLTIGKYCSIAGNIDVVMANHRTRWTSTYPFAILREFWPGSDGTCSDHIAKPIIIGSDVWIGAHACILPGTQVGDGALLAAYSLVRGVIPPYAIFSGNPGRVIGFRFSESVIARLLAIRWWDWPDWKVDAFLPLMMSDDINSFLEAAEAVRADDNPPSTPGLQPVAVTQPQTIEDPLQELGAVVRRLEGYNDPAMHDIGQALAIIQQQLAASPASGRGGLLGPWRRYRKRARYPG